VIVLATEDFELYHEAVSELRDRGITFSTVEPGTEFPDETEVVLTGTDDEITTGPEVALVRAASEEARSGVEEALGLLRKENGRTIIGIDPGEQPGIAVLSGEMIVATFQVPPERVAEVVHDEAEDATNPLVRIGDGARLVGARIVDNIEGLPVDEFDR